MNLAIGKLGMGCATLGDLWEVTPDAQAIATVDAAYEAGIRLFDTAPWYGMGKSELRLGSAIRHRKDAVIATKVGRVLHRGGAFLRHGVRGDWASKWKGGLPFDLRFDYTYAGVMRSFEDSLQRLGMPRVDALAIHDLDLLYHQTWDAVEARFDELDGGGGHRALRELRDTGGTMWIGAGINRTGLIPKFLDRFELDYFLVAMPYTLLSQEGLGELDLCHAKGVRVIIGAPFASGMLADPVSNSTYDYAPGSDEVRRKAAQLNACCARHRVALPAAALQFVLKHPAVASVIPGPNSAAQARQCVEYIQQPIPAALWAGLKAEGLIDAEAPV